MPDFTEKFSLWKTRLLDTSRRNRLLHLSPRRGHVRVLAPGADEIFAALVHRGRKLTFVPREDEPEEHAVLRARDTVDSAPGDEGTGGELPGELAIELPPDGQGADPVSPPATLEAAGNGTPEAVGGETRDDGAGERTPEGSEVEMLPDAEFSGTASEEPIEGQTDGGEHELLPQEAPVSPGARPDALRTALTGAQLTTTLYNLRSHARTAFEEQGVNILFLSFGVLHWTDPMTREGVISPLLLAPVQLERAAVTQPFTLLIRDEDILLNPTLAHKLYMDYRIQMPRLRDDNEGMTPGMVFDLIRQALEHLPSWTITPDVYLELYSFEKLVMLKDLEAHAQEIAAHPILQAIAGDPSNLPPAPPELPTARELDDAVAPLQVYQVLDADSSQQVAIEWAKRGASFVIEGPPGTGKSQTIANIIAEVLAQNKKVLFVSAKMAALEVVAKRLAKCGLENFYLEAHSHNSSRGALVAQLGRAMQAAYPEHAPALEHLTQLGELRAELNAYARGLHTPVAPLGKTPFHAYTTLATLTDAPDLYFELPGAAEMEARQFGEISETLENLAARGEIWEGQTENPWRGVAMPAYTFKGRTEIEFRFGELLRLLTPLAMASEKLADALTLPPPQSLAGIDRQSAIAKHAMETPNPPSSWFRAGATTELRAMALEAQSEHEERKRCYGEFSAHYTDALLERTDLGEMLARFEMMASTSLGSSPLRILDAQYRQDMRVVRAASKGDRAIHIPEAMDALRRAQALQALDARTVEHAAELRERFGRLFDEERTDWGAALAQLDWVDGMVALFAPDTMPESFTNLVCNRPMRLNATRVLHQEQGAARGQLASEWESLEQLFPDQAPALYAGSLPELRAWLATRLERIGELEAWLAFQSECDSLERLGGGAFLASARAAKLQGDQLEPAFWKRFYLLWLDAVYEKLPALEQNEELHRKRVTQFWRADVEQQVIARERLARQLASARPAVGWGDAPSSEVTLLKRELIKRKHHKSIRRLASEIPNLLLTLKPCLMMSPLSVSQYLAAAPVRFDLVIFDEASQIPPEEAVAAIVRAKQIIVAGDHQQLPPTPFFQALDEQDEEEWTDTNVLESLLQEAAIVLPSVRLMWHYRSRHEALLGFSNHYFYEDRLVTFPNAAAEDARLGVEFVHVPDGIYDRARTRTNPTEARVVAELVLEHFRRSPERSLGVVTFSQAQRAAIDLELQNLLRAHPELEAHLNGKRSEPLFIKSLENVQGDERDVMFFSVGYGKDANGTLTMNFGPLNGQDGARRLNVAITRAREQVKLVSSFLPAELDPARSNSRGVQLLRAYMEYAVRRGQASWTIGQGMARADGASAPQDGGEQALCERILQELRARGLETHARIGAGSERVDLAVVERGEDEVIPSKGVRYRLGIELDGETYRNANTARERERLRVQVLEQLGWRIYRLRARDWLANPALQVERIEQVLSALDTPAEAWSSKTARAKNAARANGGANGDGLEKGALVPTGMAVYTTAPLARQGTPEQFFGTQERTFEELIVQLAEQEGPIHWNAVARRIAGCWGIPRVTPAVESHLDGVLSNLIGQERVLLRDDFLWSPVTMDVLVRQPAPGQEPRPIEEIALEEIARAAYLNLKNALSLTEEDWVNLTARLLGYPRASERVKRRIQAALARLEASEIVRREDGKVELKVTK